MMRGSLPAGVPFSTLMFLKTLSAGMVSFPAMLARTAFIALSRRTALMLSRRARAESESGGRGPLGRTVWPGVVVAVVVVGAGVTVVVGVVVLDAVATQATVRSVTDAK